LCHSLVSFHFINLFSIYPFTGTTQGYGNSHNVFYNVPVKLQMSFFFMCVIPVVCVTHKVGGVVKQHN